MAPLLVAAYLLDAVDYEPPADSRWRPLSSAEPAVAEEGVGPTFDDVVSSSTKRWAAREEQQTSAVVSQPVLPHSGFTGESRIKRVTTHEAL